MALLSLTPLLSRAQHISSFISVPPDGQMQTLVLPATHRFQALIQEGEPIGQGEVLKTAPDFTAFLSKNGSSTEARLSLNHEISGQQGAVTVFDLSFDTTLHSWRLYHGMPVDMSALHGSSRPCSGGITPWGTVIYGEESILTTDADSNKYHDSGWLVEIDPVGLKALRKLWKAGNSLHENCAVAPDERTLYWGADDGNFGFLFKYIALEKRKMDQGQLFVLIRNDSVPDTGYWLPVPNQSAYQCNNVPAFCKSRGAWNFSGIEDVELGPDGRIYFSAKNDGTVWRLFDNGAAVSGLEPFVQNDWYAIETSEGVKWANWGTGADNLAFDDVGNLWVLQDGGDNNIWVVAPDHLPGSPHISLFATTPYRSEPTGITFSSDYRFMFLSLQHPSSANSQHQRDATGRDLVFNRGTTVVIARREFLGQDPYCNDLPESVSNGTMKLHAVPNPATGGVVRLFSRDFAPGEACVVRVFDPLGRYFSREVLYPENGSLSPDIKKLPEGLYLIRVECSGKTGTVVLAIE